MSTKNKTEDKLIESMRKNKTVAEKEVKNQDKKQESAESSEEVKQQKPSVKKSTDKSSFMTSKRVWPD